MKINFFVLLIFALFVSCEESNRLDSIYKHTEYEKEILDLLIGNQIDSNEYNKLKFYIEGGFLISDEDLENLSYQEILEDAKKLNQKLCSRKMDFTIDPRLRISITNKLKNGKFGSDYLNFSINFENLGEDTLNIKSYTFSLLDPICRELIKLTYKPIEEINSTLEISPGESKKKELRYSLEELNFVLKEKGVILDSRNYSNVLSAIKIILNKINFE